MIIVVGSANIDLTFRTPRLPVPGETVIGTDYFEGLGGKGANQAVAAARLGGQVSFVGKVGDDPWGEAVRNGLAAEGIDVTHLTTAPGRPTGKAAILVNDAGENSIVVSPGANHALTVSDVNKALAVPSPVVLVQCESPLEAVHKSLYLGGLNGATRVLNPAPAHDLPDALLRGADVCIPNESELGTLTNRPTDSLADVRSAAESLLDRGPGIVVVTLGHRGALVVGRDRAVHVPGIPVRAVDTSGAGEAFCGALAVGIASTGTGTLFDRVVETARWANRVAAFSVTRAGTQASFPRSDDVLPGN